MSVPYTTMPLLTPRLVRTLARGSTREASYTPKSCMLGDAGLVRGPKILNTVRMPSSLRMGPTYFMEVWYFWAKKKQMPIFFRSSTHFSGDKSKFTPSASRQSAVPQREEAARLPCLATFTPEAAMTRAEVVEMLKLWALSPPVPTISSTSMSWGTFRAWSRMAAAQPAISSMVSALVLFVERAARNAAFWVGLVSPLMISFMTLYASS